MKQPKRPKKCEMCGKALRVANKSGFCSYCWRLDYGRRRWAKLKENGKKKTKSNKKDSRRDE